jgi:hypothetical protein
MKNGIVLGLGFLLTFVGAATAEIVTIECIGSVEYNQINVGVFADVNPGDPVHAVFTIDSDDFIDSATYGVRSYPIDLASYQLQIGAAGPVPLVNPQPDGATSYFVLRNDDPAADGFFLSNDPEWPYINPSLDEPGQIDPYMGFHWEVGYNGDVLSSLDVLDAVGSYTYDGLTSFYTAIQDSWADAMGLEYAEIIISIDVSPTETLTWGSIKKDFR